MENRYTESEYQKDPEALHLYVKDFRILMFMNTKHYAMPFQRISIARFLIYYLSLAWGTSKCVGFTYIKSVQPKTNIIHLPEKAQKKQKRKQLERNIHPLSSVFS